MSRANSKLFQYLLDVHVKFRLKQKIPLKIHFHITISFDLVAEEVSAIGNLPLPTNQALILKFFEISTLVFSLFCSLGIDLKVTLQRFCC